MKFIKKPKTSLNETKKDDGEKNDTKDEYEPFLISDLPSFARLCLNLKLLEEDNLISGSKNKKYRHGWHLGSVSIPLFDQNHVLKMSEPLFDKHSAFITG